MINTFTVFDLLCQNFNLFSGQKLISCYITSCSAETSLEIKNQNNKKSDLGSLCPKNDCTELKKLLKGVIQEGHPSRFLGDSHKKNPKYKIHLAMNTPKS